MAVENLIDRNTVPYDGRKVVTTAGIAERLVASSLPVAWVDIQALRNTQYIAVGTSTVVVAVGIERGTILGPEVPVRYENIDLYDIWLDAEIDGEGVSFTYGV